MSHQLDFKVSIPQQFKLYCDNFTFFPYMQPLLINTIILLIFKQDAPFMSSL